MLSIWHVILLYHCTRIVAAASSTPVVSTTNNSTCPSRTANYLTHTLPQQCLTSIRIASSTQAVNATNVSAATTEVETITPHNIPSSPASSTELVSSDIPKSETTVTGASAVTESRASVTTVTATQIAGQELGPVIPEIIEEDSPLESGSFLSFEEWKKQNLEKVGQSEHVGRDANGDSREGRRQQSIHNSLDALGDDVEIDLDFSGFVPGGPESPNVKSTILTEPAAGEVDRSQPKVTTSRKKDAGTTCKERFNYASFDCAANLLKTNPQAKSPGSVLNENKDAYMLNQCSAENKFVILELCDYILVDTVVLANFEFFSSIFRTFRVSVSDKYPVKLDKWKILGTFEARNTREVQAFLVENPMIWAKYLRIEFLTHYGSEFYCPVSLVRVHGTTMLEEYNHDMAAVTGEDDDDIDTSRSSVEDGEKLQPEAVDEGILAAERQKEEDARLSAEVQFAEKHNAVETSQSETTNHISCPVTEISANMTMLGMESMFSAPALEVCAVMDTTETVATAAATSATQTMEASKLTTTTDASTTQNSASKTAINNSTPIEQASTKSSQAEISKATSVELVKNSTTSIQNERSTSNTSVVSQNTTNTERAKASTQASKQSSSATQSAPASPTMQESFFKSVQKRLQMLESNSSLSLQYIEEQSRALRDAFQKVEKRQLAKTSIFLDHLNATVLKELREFRQQYDHLWQSTVIELEMQREQYQRENQAMHARLGVLADELIFQKRISILQMTLILVCLVLVLFSRGVINNYLELPLVQSVLSKSSSTRWMNLSGDSPSNPRTLNRARSAISIGSSPSSILKGHRRVQSDDSVTDNLSQAEIYSPPTPVSFDFSDASLPLVEDGKPVSDPEFDAETIERPSTSPPILASEPASPITSPSKFDSFESRLFASDQGTAGNVRAAPASPAKQLKWDLPNPSE